MSPSIKAAGAYRDLLRTPGAPRIVAVAVAGGIATQGAPLAVVLLGREATGSFAGASALLAAGTVGGLALAPARGRYVDRRGPLRTVPLLAAASTFSLAMLIVAAQAKAPLPLLAALSLVGAACSPPLGAVMRTVWRDLLGDDAARHAAFGLLTVMQEITFFTGPLVAGAVIGLASPAAALATLGGLGLTAALAFVTAPATRAHARRRAPTEGGSTRWGVLAHGGMRTVAMTAGLAGATFGILDVALPAAARHAGAAGAAGLLLSALALGIGVGGFVYGLVPPDKPPGRLYGPLCALAAVGLAPLVAASDGGIGPLTALLVLAGLAFAPLTTCQFALIDHIVPRDATTEAMAVLGTAYGASAAVGAQVAGALVDGPGLRAAFASACGCAALAAVVATARRESLLHRDAPATIDP